MKKMMVLVLSILDELEAVDTCRQTFANLILTGTQHNLFSAGATCDFVC